MDATAQETNDDSGRTLTAGPGWAVPVVGFGLLVVPLVRWARLEDSFTTPKLLSVVLVAMAVLVGALVGLNRRRAGANAMPAVPVSPAGWLLMILFAWNAGTAAYAQSSALAAYALAMWGALLGWFLACRVSLRSPCDVMCASRWLVGAAVATAAWTLAEDATHGGVSGIRHARLPDWRGYLSAGLGNSGHIAGLIGYALPFAIVPLLDRARRTQWWAVVSLAVMLPALVVTWSVGSTGAAVIALVVWALVAATGPGRTDIHWARLGIPVVIGLAAAAFYFLPHPLNPHSPSLWKEAFASDRWKEGGPTRLAIWMTTWHMIKSSPLLGVGFGNFTLAYPQQVVPAVQGDPALAVYAGAFTNDAHNEYLHLWAEGGLAALLLFGAIAVRCLWISAGAARRGRTAAVRLAGIAVGASATAFLLDAIMTFPLRLPAHHAMFLFVLAAAEAVHDTHRRSVNADAGAATANPGGVPGLGNTLLCGICVIVLVCGVRLGMRGMAEYWLKLGRLRAEAAQMTGSGQFMSPWHHAEQAMSAATMALAGGDHEQFRRLAGEASKSAISADMEVAEQRFRKALSYDARYSNASSRLGALLLMQGRAAEAVEVLEGTLRDLQSSEIYERLGVAYMLLGHPEESQPCWLTAAERRPVAAPFLRALAQSARGSQ